MRNYIKELKDRGYTYKILSKETGLSVNKLSSLAKGKSKLKSNTKVYENVRNTSRRKAYRELVESGTDSKDAGRLRRTVFYQRDMISSDKVRKVQSLGLKGCVYQLTILAEYYDSETQDLQLVYGHSKALKKKDFELQKFQAKEGAMSELNLSGGSDVPGIEAASELNVIESWYVKFVIDKK